MELHMKVKYLEYLVSVSVLGKKSFTSISHWVYAYGTLLNCVWYLIQFCDGTL